MALANTLAYYDKAIITAQGLYCDTGYFNSFSTAVLSDVMISVILPIVVMLNVVAPTSSH
jgi:hypothetical protein